MDRHQIIDLLSMIAAFDKRKVGQVEVEAWHMAIGTLDLDDARQAVAEHFATSTDYLMPVHVAGGVKRIRTQRLERSITAAPPPDLADDARAAKHWLDQQIKAIADGKSVNKVLGIEAGKRRQGAPPAEHQERRSAMGGVDVDAINARQAALQVGCPHCGAGVGRGCVRSGTSEPLTGLPAHDARVHAAAGKAQ